MHSNLSISTHLFLCVSDVYIDWRRAGGEDKQALIIYTCTECFFFSEWRFKYNFFSSRNVPSLLFWLWWVSIFTHCKVCTNGPMYLDIHVHVHIKNVQFAQFGPIWRESWHSIRLAGSTHKEEVNFPLILLFYSIYTSQDFPHSCHVLQGKHLLHACTCTWCFTHCRPQFMTLYLNEPDHSGHAAGPDSALVSWLYTRTCTFSCVYSHSAGMHVMRGSCSEQRDHKWTPCVQTALRPKCQVSLWSAALDHEYNMRKFTCMWHRWPALISTSHESS